MSPPDILADAACSVLELANMRVRIKRPGRRNVTMTRFEACLLELASPGCRRRIQCQDFIAQVVSAVRTLENL